MLYKIKKTTLNVNILPQTLNKPNVFDTLLSSGSGGAGLGAPWVMSGLHSQRDFIG
jgi:hypothetical protein